MKKFNLVKIDLRTNKRPKSGKKQHVQFNQELSIPFTLTELCEADIF